MATNERVRQTDAVEGWVFDVGERDWQAQVIERSGQVPVVVDFWAPWCGPCRVLGPILERLADEMQGAFVLAKLNVDENQGLARTYGARSIPLVVALRNGQLVDSFTGALPETRVRSWLAKLIPSAVDQLAEEAARLEATEPQTAQQRYRAALAEQPTHVRSLLGLGRMLALAGDPEGATVLRRVPAGDPGYPQAQALLVLADFLGKASAGQSNGAPNEPYAAAATHARSGQWETALQTLLGLIQRSRASGQDTPQDARRAMLAIFDVLGSADPLVTRYRRALANALF